MAEASGFPVGNVLLYAAIVMTPTAASLGALRLPALVRGLKLRMRPAPPVPEHPPIQELAADLRRVHRLLAQFRPGTPMARRVGARQAYDALLVEACDAVDVEQRLDQMPEGIAREVERLRLEVSLRSAGLAIP
jgi:hypothetical protein